MLNHLANIGRKTLKAQEIIKGLIIKLCFAKLAFISCQIANFPKIYLTSFCEWWNQWNLDSEDLDHKLGLVAKNGCSRGDVFTQPGSHGQMPSVGGRPVNNREAALWTARKPALFLFFCHFSL